MGTEIILYFIYSLESYLPHLRGCRFGTADHSAFRIVAVPGRLNRAEKEVAHRL